MKTVQLTDPELILLRNAMQTYLSSFGHNEADVVEQVKHVLAKLSTAAESAEEPTQLIG